MITDTELKAALKASAGIPALAAEKLGCTRQNVCQRIARSPEMQEFVADIEATILDAAQSVITEAIVVKKDQKMARWYLQTKGKHLGFTTRQEVSGPGGGAIPLASKVQVEVTYVDSPETEEDIL